MLLKDVGVGLYCKIRDLGEVKVVGRKNKYILFLLNGLELTMSGYTVVTDIRKHKKKD